MSEQSLSDAMLALARQQRLMARRDVERVERGLPAVHFLFPYAAWHDATQRIKRIDAGYFDMYEGEKA